MSSESAVARTEQRSPDGGTTMTTSVDVRRESVFISASELEMYEKLKPGVAGDLLSLFTEQIRHRMSMEEGALRLEQDKVKNDHNWIQIEREKVQVTHDSTKLALESDRRNRKQAVDFGMIALILFISLGVFFACMGMEIAAIAAILVPAIQCIGDWIGKLIKNQDTKSNSK